MKKANTMGLPFMRVHLRVEEALVRLTLGNKMLVLETLSEGQLFCPFSKSSRSCTGMQYKTFSFDLLSYLCVLT